MFLYQVYALCVKLILPLLLIVFCSVIWLRNGGNKLCFGLILLILVKDLNKLDFGLFAVLCWGVWTENCKINHSTDLCKGI